MYYLSLADWEVDRYDEGANLYKENTGTSPDRFGNPKGAFYFDGTSASLSLALTKKPRLNSPITISWWYSILNDPLFKDSMDAGNMIALVDTVQAIGLQFGFRAPGYRTKGLDIWNWGGATILETQIPELNQWHHCVYVYDGHEHQFFLDGELKEMSDIKPQKGNPDFLMLGNYPGGSQFFKGSLDEIRIYEQALTRNQILALLNMKKH
ncbi:hypothetical protein GCM10011412_05920 [Maribacter cobaltidurans]|nr:hypothetical protein GCM10011412_05920 [Maribacter cobaltidurans]